MQHQVIQRDDMAFVRKLTVAVGADFKGAQVTISPAEAEGAQA